MINFSMLAMSLRPSMRPTIGGIDMVNASTITNEKNSNREPNAQAATVAAPKPATSFVAKIAETGGNSWLSIAGAIM